jgi:hypothetical protein
LNCTRGPARSFPLHTAMCWNWTSYRRPRRSTPAVWKLLDDNWFLASHFKIEVVPNSQRGVRSSKVISSSTSYWALNLHSS